MITMHNIIDMVDTIRRMRHDPEAAHVREDRLYRWVLRAIAVR